MRAIHLLLVAPALGALGCAAIKSSTAPGATAAMTEHQFDELAFEMPVGWEAGTVPDGVNLLRCTEREPRASLAVEVNLTDRFASGCEKPEDVMAGLFQGLVTAGGPTPYTSPDASRRGHIDPARLPAGAAP